MITDRRSDQQLIAYMQSRAFRRRVKRMQKIAGAKWERGEGVSFDEIAKGLDLPLDVVVGGFASAMRETFGDDLVPVGRMQ